MKRFLLSLLEAAAYVAGYLLLQLIVSLAFGAYFGFRYGIQLYYDNSMFNSAHLVEYVTEQLLSHATLLSFMVNVLTLVALVLLCLIRRGGPKKILHLQPVKPWVFAPVFLLALGACGAVTLILTLLPISPEAIAEYSDLVKATTQGSNALLSFAATVILAPVVEEAIFRGLVYPTLRKANGVFFALLIESLIFGALHGNTIWVAYAACMGVIMTLVFEATGSLWGSIAFHVSFNFLGSYVGFFTSETLVGNLFFLLCALMIMAAGSLLLSRYRKDRLRPKPE